MAPVSEEDLLQSLRQVANEFGNDPRIAEAELVNRWFTGGVFSSLGFGTHRDDYRIELTIPGTGRADVILRILGQRARALLEFKRPGTPLDEHVRQLSDYAERILNEVAILTNGKDFWLYNRTGPLPLDPLHGEPNRLDLTALTVSQARQLFAQLRKTEVDLTDVPSLTRALAEIAARPVPIEAPAV